MLSKSEVDFANNHGAMPPLSGMGFGFEAVGFAELGKNSFAKHQAKLTNCWCRIANLGFN